MKNWVHSDGGNWGLCLMKVSGLGRASEKDQCDCCCERKASRAYHSKCLTTLVRRIIAPVSSARSVPRLGASRVAALHACRVQAVQSSDDKNDRVACDPCQLRSPFQLLS